MSGERLRENPRFHNGDRVLSANTPGERQGGRRVREPPNDESFPARVYLRGHDAESRILGSAREVLREPADMLPNAVVVDVGLIDEARGVSTDPVRR